MDDYLRHFKYVIDNLSAIGKPINDRTKVFCLLCGLGPQYESFTSAMLKPPVPSYKEIVPLLQCHETRSQSYVNDYTNCSMALFGQKFDNKKRNKGSQQFTSRGHGFVQTSRQSNAQNAEEKQKMALGGQQQKREGGHCQILTQVYYG